MSNPIITIEIPEGKVAKQTINPDGSITISYVDKEPICSKSWREFCENHPTLENEWFVDPASNIVKISKRARIANGDKNNLSSKEDAEGILALIQLTRLHDEWVGGWVPNFENAVIYYNKVAGSFQVVISSLYRLLTFPTSAMAEEFFECFEDLILKAKKFL